MKKQFDISGKYKDEIYQTFDVSKVSYIGKEVVVTTNGNFDTFGIEMVVDGCMVHMSFRDEESRDMMFQKIREATNENENTMLNE